MNSGLRRRIEALEQRVVVDPVQLLMRDGTVRLIAGTAKHYLRLAALLCSADEEVHPPSCELRWLRDCEEIRGSGAEAFNLLHVLSLGANDTEEDQEIADLLNAKTAGGVE